MHVLNVHARASSAHARLLSLLLQLAVMGISSCSEYLEVHAETSSLHVTFLHPPLQAACIHGTSISAPQKGWYNSSWVFFDELPF